MKFLVTACLVTLFSTNLLAQNSSSATVPIQVMVLGIYHFDNPGQDLHNMKVDSVVTPAKQSELADVASRLAKFNPTKIAVEALSDRPDFVSNKFDGFTPEKLSKDPDERTQIALRLAHQLARNPSMGSTSRATRLITFHSTK